MEVGSWNMEVGRWKWKMEVGRWKLEDGSWKMEVGMALFGHRTHLVPLNFHLYRVQEGLCIQWQANWNDYVQGNNVSLYNDGRHSVCKTFLNGVKCIGQWQRPH